MDAPLQNALAELHTDLLELLADAVRVLEAHGLPYSLMCGSLLGAVRHQGFIPWDDDVDLVLPRHSYEQFAAFYPTQCGKGFCLDLADTWVPRVKRSGGGEHAFIDLFVLDPLPDRTLPRLWKTFRLRTLQGMLKTETDYKRFSIPKQILLHGTAFLGRLFSKKTKLNAYARIARSGNRQSKNVHMANGAYHLLNMPFSPQTFEHPLPVIPFEKLQLRIPQNAHEVLVQLYGADYMTPPPEAARKPQHIKLC